MADYVYRLPPEHPSPPPAALLTGLEWREMHTPPVSGGLRDQPMHLMKHLRLALTVYDVIQAYRGAEALGVDAFSRFCARNPRVMTTMQTIWDLQDEENKDKT